jgi:curli production assembly/transport component CsgG
MRQIFALLLLIALAGCAGHAGVNGFKAPETAVAPLQQQFKAIPELDGPKITIAVYSFNDKTGQRKPSQNFSQLSSAVTQGAEVWVIQALSEVGNNTWFTVVERGGLDNLVKERQLIRSTREQYEDEKDKKLRPLLFAGLIVEGAVVGYDSNVVTGGSGARYLGIGAKTQYRVDTVTVSMRIVSVSTGEVLLSVATQKDIASYSTGADVFKFLDLGTKLIEVEAGTAVNEPVNYAVRAAIEQAVCDLVELGHSKGLWNYKAIVIDSQINNPQVNIREESK